MVLYTINKATTQALSGQPNYFETGQQGTRLVTFQNTILSLSKYLQFHSLIKKTLQKLFLKSISF